MVQMSDVFIGYEPSVPLLPTAPEDLNCLIIFKCRDPRLPRLLSLSLTILRITCFFTKSVRLSILSIQLSILCGHTFHGFCFLSSEINKGLLFCKVLTKRRLDTKSHIVRFMFIVELYLLALVKCLLLLFLLVID